MSQARDDFISTETRSRQCQRSQWISIKVGGLLYIFNIQGQTARATLRELKIDIY